MKPDNDPDRLTEVDQGVAVDRRGGSGARPPAEPSGEATGASITVADTTLVEGISIDGMCGVY